MKVAIVSDYLPKYHRIWSGAELLAVSLCEMLKSKGCEVFLMTVPFDFPVQGETDRVLPINAPLRRLGAISRNFPIDIGATANMYRALKKEKPDIAHINAKYLFLPTLITCSLLKIPTLFTVPDYFILCPTTFIRKPDGNNCDSYHGKNCYDCLSVLSEGLLKKILNCIPKFLVKLLLHWRAMEFNYFLKRISAFVALSNVSKQRLIDYGIPEEKIKVIYHYRISSPGETVEDIRSPSAVFVGWLSEENGIGVLIKAFAQVASEIKEAKLYLVGTGNENFVSRVKTEISEFQIDGNIIFLGKKQNQEALAIMSKCDFVVVPHQWAKEFGPIIVLEALALGKPVIASKIGATHEFVKESENGFLVKDYRNPKAFADSMAFLFNNPEKIKEMGKKAKESASFLLGNSLSVDMIKLYNDLLKGGK